MINKNLAGGRGLGMKSKWKLCLIVLAIVASSHQGTSGENFRYGVRPASQMSSLLSNDTLINQSSVEESTEALRNVWGLDILISNDGFGFGAFYRREFNRTLSGFASFSISESKDEKEVERFDPYTQTSFTPGKYSRFLVLPLMFGVQNRLFADDITETFRPYINAAVGPTMIFATPFVQITESSVGSEIKQVEFFKSLGKGQPHYTIGGYVGVGANFGADRSSVFGVNFRYYFTYLLGDGLPSLYTYSRADGVQIISRKKDFGGFFITLNVGLAN